MARGGGLSRLMGVGFLFGARDNGAVRTAEAVSSGFDGVTRAVREAGESSSALQRLGNALSALNVLQLDRIGDQLESLADRAGVNAQTTQIESFGAQFSQTFRQATAGMGEYADIVRRARGAIGGVAFNLGVDAGDMLQVATAAARAGHSLEDYGLSARAVGGSIQAGILSGEQLGNLLTGLSEGYDLGADGAGALLDRITALGEAFGVGADAARQLPSIIDAANPVLSRFSNLSIEGVTESITRLAIATQQRLGGTFEEAVRSATQTFSQLGEQRSAFAQLFTGLNSEFPQLAESIGIAGRDIDEAMSMVMDDPLQFASRMREMMQGLNDTDRQRLLQSLDGFDDNFRFLITGGDDAAAALQAASRDVGDATGAFSRVARQGSGSTRTFAESMELLNDRFQTQLNAMARNRDGMNQDRRVLQRQRAAYDALRNTLQGFSERGGVLGNLTDAFLSVRRYGLVHGLLPVLEDRLPNVFPGLREHITTFAPVLEGLGDGLLQAATSAGPFVLAMQQMGVFRGVSSVLGGVNSMLGGLPATLMGVLGPAALVAGAGYLMYQNWDTIEPMLRNLGPALESAGEMALDLSRQFALWVQGIDWEGIGRQIGQFLGDAMQFAGEVLGGIDTSGFGRGLLEFLQNTVGQIGGAAVPQLINGLFGDSVWGTVFQTMFDASGLGAITRAINSGRISEAIFEILFSAFTLGLGPLGMLVGNEIREMFNLSTLGGGYLEGAFDGLQKSWNDYGAPVMEAFGLFWEDLQEVAGDFFDEIMPAFEGITDWFQGPFRSDAVAAGRGGFRQLGQYVHGLWEDYARPAFIFMLRGFNLMIAGMGGTLNTFVAAARRAFVSLRLAFEVVRAAMQHGWRAVGLAVRNFFLVPILEAQNTWVSLSESLTSGIDALELSFMRLGRTLIGGFQTAFMSLPEIIRNQMPGIESALSGAVSSFDTQISDREREIRETTLRRQREREQRMSEIASVRAEAQQAADQLAQAERAARERARRDMADIDQDESRVRDVLVRAGRGVDQAVQRMDRRMQDGGPRRSTDVSSSERGDVVVSPPVADAADTTESGPGEGVSETSRTRAEQHRRERRAEATRRREAQEQAAQAQREEAARAMMISSFGPDAARQLAQAFRSSGAGGAAGRRGGTPQGGTGVEAL